jgi:hypothetical protein
MKIIDKFTKSEDKKKKKKKRRRKLFIHTLGIIFFIKDYKIASWGQSIKQLECKTKEGSKLFTSSTKQDPSNKFILGIHCDEVKPQDIHI